MKLYNPIVNGMDIIVEGKSFPKDSKLEVAKETKEQYPFLVDLSEEKYSPDKYETKEPITLRRIKRGVKRIFHVLG